jgi:hypothetical protein
MRYLAFSLVFAILGFSCVPAVADEAPKCPLSVTSVAAYGIAPQITVFNKADYPVNILVFHVTWNDGLNRYQERDFRPDGKVLVQPHKSLVYTGPVISDSIVKWDTLDASVGCKPLDDN